MNIVITCPNHGDVESNTTGFMHPDIPITEYCPACVGDRQTAEYDKAVARAKAKNPNYKPLKGSVFVGFPRGQQ